MGGKTNVNAKCQPRKNDQITYTDDVHEKNANSNYHHTSQCCPDVTASLEVVTKFDSQIKLI